MTLDVKLPRWLALFVFALWAVSIAESIVCQAINARANLHYLAGDNAAPPPPPYPGVQERTAPAGKPEPKRPILDRKRR